MEWIAAGGEIGKKSLFDDIVNATISVMADSFKEKITALKRENDEYIDELSGLPAQKYYTGCKAAYDTVEEMFNEINVKKNENQKVGR